MKTNPIKRILIPTDFSETGILAVKHAALMTQLCQAELHLLHAVEIPVSAFNIYNAELIREDISEIEKSAERKPLPIKI